MEFVSALILLVGGIFTGIYASTAGGGSLVMFPLLVITGLPTPAAIATNRVAAIFLEAASIIRFRGNLNIDWKVGVRYGLVSAVGAVIGSLIVLAIDVRLLNLIMIFFLVNIPLILLRKNDWGKGKGKLPAKYKRLLPLVIFLSSIYGGFFGAAFGTFIMFLMVMMGYSYLEGSALARLIGLILSIAASVVFLASGLVNFEYTLYMSVGLCIGAWIGVGLAVNRGERYVKTLFFVVIAISVIKLLTELV